MVPPTSSRLADAAGRIRGRLSNPSYVDWGAFGIDTRSLAVFRVGLGLLVIADVLLRSRNFSFFYTEEGVVPQSLATMASSEYAFSVYYYTTSPTVIAALFAVKVLVALQLIVGYRTTLATVLTFLLVVSLDHHNPLVLSYADVLFRLLLFWAIFLPLGERWSVDAVHADAEPRAQIASVASAAILLQFVYMYFVNGVHKTESELWTGGEATPLIMGLDNTTFLLGEFMRNFPTFLLYGGLTWYYLLLFSGLLVLLRGRPRTLFTAMFLGGHASFAITVRIGAFAYVAIVGLVLFLQASFWRDAASLARALRLDRTGVSPPRAHLEGFARRLPQFRFDSPLQRRAKGAAYGGVLALAVVAVLVVPALSMLPVAGFVDDDGGPAEPIDEATSAIGVSQPEWSVFAPHPRTTDRYYVFAAATEDGDHLDVYNDRPLTYDRQYDALQKQFGTYRERFYMNSVRRGGPDDVVSETLAEHYCTTWAEERGVNLTHVNMYYVAEDVTHETIDDHEERDRDIERFYAHGCGDNEPTEIAPPT